jgi:O-antigen ligase
MSTPTTEKTARPGVTLVALTNKAEFLRHKVRLFDSVITVTLAGLLIFSILAFGGSEDWAIFLFEIVAVILGLMWAARQSFIERLDFHPNWMYIPALVFAAVIVVQIVAGRTVTPYATLIEGLKYVALGIVFFVSDQVMRSGRARKQFLHILLAFGVFVSLLALVQQFAGAPKIYWFRATVWPFYGPYANHNHYAGMMEMLIAIPFVLALTSELRREFVLLLIAAGIFMASTLVLSRSRGGMIAFAIQILLWSGYLLRNNQRKVRLMIGTAGVLVMIVLMLYSLGGSAVFEHLGTLRQPMAESVSGNRLTILKDTLHMAGQRPILGWGLNSFETAYPQFRSFATQSIVNFAHNDYAQLLAETGVVGFLAVMVFLGMMYFRGIRAIVQDSANRNPAAAVALLGCSGLLVHSLVDFNMHITANVGLFLTFCALTGNARKRDMSRDEHGRSSLD